VVLEYSVKLAWTSSCCPALVWHKIQEALTQDAKLLIVLGVHLILSNQAWTAQMAQSEVSGSWTCYQTKPGLHEWPKLAWFDRGFKNHWLGVQNCSEW